MTGQLSITYYPYGLPTFASNELIKPKVATYYIMLKYLISLFCIVTCVMPTHGQNAYKIEMPEMITRDYAFMNGIADIIKNTNHRITDPNANIIISDSCTYNIYVKTINRNGTITYNKTIDLKPDKSYFIEITYRLYDYGIRPIVDCIFNINDIKFTTSQYLNIFFIGCKISKCEFPYHSYGLFFDRFWFFEIHNGIIKNAFYYYEKDELDLDNSLVYDLLNEKSILYGKWRKTYTFFL